MTEEKKDNKTIKPKEVVKAAEEVKMVALPENTVNAILSYIGTKPLNETYDLVNAIRSQVVPVKK